MPQVSTLWFVIYSQDKIFKLQVTTARLHPLANLPTKYGFQDTAQTNFFLPSTRLPPWMKILPTQPLKAVG